MGCYYYAIDEENKVKYCLDKDVNAKKLLPFLSYIMASKPITLLSDNMEDELNKYSDYKEIDSSEIPKLSSNYNYEVIDYCELSYAEFYDIFNTVKGRPVDISNYIRYPYGLFYLKYKDNTLYENENKQMDYYLIDRKNSRAYYFKNIDHLKRYLPFVCYLERFSQLFLFEGHIFCNETWNDMFFNFICTKKYDIISCDESLSSNPNYMKDAIDGSELSNDEISSIVSTDNGIRLLDNPERCIPVTYSSIYSILNSQFVSGIIESKSEFGKTIEFLKGYFGEIRVNPIISDSGYYVIFQIPSSFSLVKDNSYAELVLTISEDFKLTDARLVQF